MYKILTFLLLLGLFLNSQAQDDKEYKKKVLEQTEIDLLYSYYKQDGDHSAVTGGKGTEEITNHAPIMIVSTPLSDDEVLTVEGGVDYYTSASSSMINPFDGKSSNGKFEYSGASEKDARAHLDVTYEKSNDSRTKTWGLMAGLSNEYDYTSFNLGASLNKSFNDNNTEFGAKVRAYIDNWKILYPSEFRGNDSFVKLDKSNRNSYSLSLSLAQILSRNLQVVFMTDLVYQTGLLSTPYQRVYFSDKPITTQQNFELAHDIERLPDTRFKLPIGMRLSYYVNDIFTVRTFYRFYTDDWGLSAHTASIEVPIKLNRNFMFYPTYRYHTQTGVDYFAAKGEHLSTEKYYTSDYDLSDISSHQVGFGFRYEPVYSIMKFGSKLKMKSIDFRYNNYKRSDDLKADIVSLAIKFTL
jgi:hypothetical protein